MHYITDGFIQHCTVAINGDIYKQLTYDLKAPDFAAFLIKLLEIASSNSEKPFDRITAVMWFRENLKQNSSNSWKKVGN